MKRTGRADAISGLACILMAACSSNGNLTSQNGRCGPMPNLLVSSASLPGADAGSGHFIVGMALDGSDLYFSVGTDPYSGSVFPGSLMHVSTLGGPATQLASGYQFQAPVVTSTSVIVGANSPSTFTGAILSIPRGGGAPTPLVDLGNDELVTRPATDGTTLYFAANAGVQSVSLTPDPSPALPTMLSSDNASGLGLFGQTLLVLVHGRINGIPIGSSAGGAEVQLAVPPGPPASASQPLIACGANVCWVAQTIEQMAPAGGPVTTPVNLPNEPYLAPPSLLSDGTNFFVVVSPGNSYNNTAIERAPLQGGAAATVATLSSSTVLGLAADDACLYFSTQTGIYSLLKSAEGVVIP